MDRVGCSWMIYAFAAAWFFASSGFPHAFSSRPVRTAVEEAAGVAGAVGRAVDGAVDLPAGAVGGAAGAARNAARAFRGGENRSSRECLNRKKTVVGALSLYCMENGDSGEISQWTLVATGYLKSVLSCPFGGDYRIERRGIRFAVCCDAHEELLDE